MINHVDLSPGRSLCEFPTDSESINFVQRMSSVMAIAHFALLTAILLSILAVLAAGVFANLIVVVAIVSSKKMRGSPMYLLLANLVSKASGRLTGRPEPGRRCWERFWSGPDPDQNFRARFLLLNRCPAKRLKAIANACLLLLF